MLLSYQDLEDWKLNTVSHEDADKTWEVLELSSILYIQGEGAAKTKKVITIMHEYFAANFVCLFSKHLSIITVLFFRIYFTA